jgi:hypothetical protein
MTMATECVFCEIMAGRAPGDIVYADDLTVATYGTWIQELALR